MTDNRALWELVEKWRDLSESKHITTAEALLYLGHADELAAILERPVVAGTECSICNGTQLVPRGVLGGMDYCKACNPRYSYGHCPDFNQSGGCKKHNLHCGYPDCDRRTSDESMVRGKS